MKFILSVNNMYVKNVAIDSYDGTTSCSFSSNIEDGKEFLENDVKIIKSLIEELLSVKIVVLAKGGDINDD